MKTIFTHIVCAMLLFVFLYTGIHKLVEFQNFRYTILQAIPFAAAATVLAILVPVFEIATAICLFVPRLRYAGLLASLALLTVFTIYISAMLIFSSSLPCSCGGVLSTLSWQQHLFFNGFFILLSLWAILVNRPLE